MGSVFRILNAGAEHIQAQGQIDAARVTQASRNAAQLSIVESKKIVQTANNAASTMYAAANERVRTANNTVSAALVGARRQMQVAYNDQATRVAAAKDRLRMARNDASAAKSSFALWGQSAKNQKIMKAGGEALNQVTMEMGALVDQATTADLFARLAASEVLGASMAQAAASGASSGFTEQFSQVVNLREGLRIEREKRELNSRLYAGAKARAQVLGDSIDSLQIGQDYAQLDFSAASAELDYSAVHDEQDFTPIIDQQDYEVFSPDLDYTVYVDHKKMGLGTQLFSLAAAGAATYFGGPMAGMAVADSFMAMNDFKNGNQAAARQGFDNAFANARGGWNTYRAGATKQADGSVSSGAAWGAQALAKAGAWLKI